jgi:hypothetical protein
MSSSAEQQSHGGSSGSGSTPAAGPNAAAAANIRVYVRVRPLNARELSTGASAAAPCLSVVPAASSAAGSATTSSSSASTTKLVQLHAKPDARLFAFDEVADERASQADVFERVGRPITEACLAGYNGTIFGQTNAQLRRCDTMHLAAHLPWSVDLVPVTMASKLLTLGLVVVCAVRVCVFVW